MGKGRVERKINRVLVNGEWINLFPNLDANFMLLGVSNYSPRLVYTQYGMCGRLKPFKFFDMWVKYKEFINVVKEGWNIQVSSSHLFQVTQKFKSVKNKLRTWNRTTFGHVDKQNEVLREEMFKL